MPHLATAIPLPPDEPLGQRLAVLAFCLLFGAWLIHVGRLNVRSRHAEEAGKRAIALTLAGKSTTVQGKWAVAMGWMRIVMGVAVLALGIVFFFFGAFLK